MLRTAASTHGKNARMPNLPAGAENRPLQESVPPGKAADSPTDAASPVTNSESTAQARKLKLRKARFRGAAVAPRNFTPPPHTGGSGDFGYDADTLEDVDSSPLDTRHHKEGTEAGITDDTGVLQEISNSSMRRKKKNGTHGRTSLPRSTRAGSQGAASSLVSLYQFPDTKPSTSSANVADSSNLQPLAANSSDRVEGTGAKRARTGPTKPANFRQFASEAETKQYIEHLESQLAAMEAQINSLGSPDSTRSQAAKLKALTTESKMLRQEVSDWEERFNERVHQQVEEHEITIRSLKAQVKLVQRASDAANENLKLMEAESEGMKQQIESVERLNQDLERRVELMSELLAKSPTKTNFDDPSLRDVPQRSPSRLTSRILPVSSRLSMYTRDSGAVFNRQATPGSPSLLSRRPDLGDNSASACLVQAGTYRALSMDIDSETSQRALINDDFTSPERRRLTGQFFQSDSETRKKPARRMRRFYTGSTGPKALILPVTAQSGQFVASAPVTAAPTPSLSAVPLEDFPLSPVLQRNNSTPFKAQTLPRNHDIDHAAETFTLAEDISVPPKSVSVSFPAELTPLPHHPVTGSVNIAARSSAGRDSIISVHGETLFQELVRVKSREDHNDKSEVKTPEAVKPVIPPSLSTNPEIGANYNPFETPKKILDHGGDNTELLGPLQEPLSEMTLPLRVLGRIKAAASKSIDHRVPRIKYFLISAWSMLTLSRPVLEFRWWLVTLLIGGLRKRNPRSFLLRRPETGLGISLQPRLTRSSGFGYDGACDDEDESDTRETGEMAARHKREISPFARRHPASYASDSALWDIFETREKYKHATPPPVSWLKLSVTLAFAVGIAIKDGPASLFRSRGARPLRPLACREAVVVSEGGALDSDSDDDY